MSSEIIFETEKLVVRKLLVSDLDPYHEMQSNPKVMQYVTGEVQSKEAHLKELQHLIDLYDQKKNVFWIYAIHRKLDSAFVGTLALIKDEQGDDEIGYRFLERYWGLGYGYDVCLATIRYCQSRGMQKLIGYVFDANVASAKILEKCNFKVVSRSIEPETNLPETKYELIL
jgi:RimJ/RimL family protein N-acetyltransferase